MIFVLTYRLQKIATTTMKKIISDGSSSIIDYNLVYVQEYKIDKITLDYNLDTTGTPLPTDGDV